MATRRISRAVALMMVLGSFGAGASVVAQSSSDAPGTSAAPTPTPSPEPGTFTGAVHWSFTWAPGDRNGVQTWDVTIQSRMAWRDTSHQQLYTLEGTYAYRRTIVGGSCPYSWDGSGVISSDPDLLVLPPGVGSLWAFGTDSQTKEFVMGVQTADFQTECWALDHESLYPFGDQAGTVAPPCLQVVGTDAPGTPVSFTLQCTPR
ncbi:MAG: hypothetical protein LH650_01140, partial [Chloroflexi bacterium]|nr:hypothetical protein [Chloroflexota bacterium]